MEENKYLPRTIKDWKEDIRDVLLRVRTQMISFIDDFTERFVRQIAKVEQQRRELSTFIGEDRRQGDRMKYIEKRLERIDEILKKIEVTQPNEKAEAVKGLTPEMTQLENEVLKKDQEMKQMGNNVRRAIDNAVELKGLSHKLFSKYMNYIQSQVNMAIQERQSLVPISYQRRGIEQPKYNEVSKKDLKKDTSADLIEDVGSVCGDELPNYGTQIESTADCQGIGPDPKTIQGKYASAGKNTLYFLPTTYH